MRAIEIISTLIGLFFLLPLFIKIERKYLYFFYPLITLIFVGFLFLNFKYLLLLNVVYSVFIVFSLFLLFTVPKKYLLAYSLVFVVLNLFLSLVKLEFLTIYFGALVLILIATYFIRSLENDKN
jgi:hypothetical protein